ncbi:hypothetical protein N7931_17260 [Catenovulum sp. 2E275]|uniref:hypothetical protein n=1 Tax=Catenovulum sp. 2E275 TaxID=2980497 RepID=UPI0021CFB47D|nr:hypothetical protein [Catenovulum sp. 2E275]MCU4677374.1 hypothetical protein [Catenovulum sp. 2E275]
MQLKVLPENGLKDSIHETKEAYNEYKLRKKGGKRRDLTKQITMIDGNRQQTEQVCLSELRQQVETESLTKPVVEISAKTSQLQSENLIECNLVAYVWP